MKNVKLRDGLKNCNYCNSIIFSDSIRCNDCLSDPRQIKVPEITQNALFSLKRLNSTNRLSKAEEKVIERLRFNKTLDIYLFDPKSIRWSFTKNILTILKLNPDKLKDFDFKYDF